jgi:hypothetical protein
MTTYSIIISEAQKDFLEAAVRHYLSANPIAGQCEDGTDDDEVCYLADMFKEAESDTTAEEIVNNFTA